MYSAIIRPLLFLLDAEKAHHFASFFVRILGSKVIASLMKPFLPIQPDERIEIMGLEFRSRLGLAAGFDKDANMFSGLGKMGFGFVEVGTVTPKAQSGNPKPRLFRLKKDKALINRMGFNNQGVMSMASRLRDTAHPCIIGGNIGKNKLTPNDEAIDDYITCFKALHEYVDYFTINVSSPNTPGLRELQDKGPLTEILNAVQKLNRSMQIQRPILLKIAPDLTVEQLDEIVDIVKETGIQGVIATNTTIDRSDLNTDAKTVENIGAGGLSGLPLTDKSKMVVGHLRKKAGGEMIIIGVGGIFSKEDARAMIDAGADLVQIYTGFIYKGPSIISEINTELENIEGEH